MCRLTVWVRVEIACMGIYLERDIGHIMAPYSYRQQFVRLPGEYAAEIAWETMPSRSSEHYATTAYNARHIDTTVPIDEIPVALGLFARGVDGVRCCKRATRTGVLSWTRDIFPLATISIFRSAAKGRLCR